MTKKILYGVGLLIVLLMILGLAINYLGKWIGIDRPLNSGVILGTFWFTVLVLVLINKDRIWKLIKSLHFNLPLAVWLLIALPIMAVVGAELVNATGNNIILMVMLPLIAVVPIICMFTKLIPQKYWGFAVWMMSLSILLHRALVSPYLTGTDNVMELNNFIATYRSGLYPSPNVINPAYNTVLSTTILPVMISKVTFISGLWIFKLVLPILLSLLPVAVYELVKGQFNGKVAFLSSFLVMSVFTFFTILLISEKQLVAAVLFVIFFLLLFDNIKYKMPILGALGVGVVLSHYGTVILFIILFAGVCLVLRKKGYFALLAIFLVACCWYLIPDNGVQAGQIAILGQSIITPSEMLTKSQTMNEIVRLFTQGVGYLPFYLLVFYVISQIMIVGGSLLIAWRWMKNRDYKLEYLALAFMCLVLLALELYPRFSSLIGIDRIYIYCMVVLAPLMFVMLLKMSRRWVLISVVFLTLFFEGNVGFINQIIGHPLSNSISISKDVDYPSFTTKEMEGAKWALDNNEQVFTDVFSQYAIFYYDASAGVTDINYVSLLRYRLDDKRVIVNDVPAGSFIYLRKYNVANNELTLNYYNSHIESTVQYSVNDLGDFSEVVNSAKTVYENSDCKIIQTTIGYEGS